MPYADTSEAGQAGHPRTNPVRKRAARNASNAIPAAEEKVFTEGRKLVLVTSYRKRLCDMDNLYTSAKFVCDSLREAGIIDNDDVKSITLLVRQVQCKEERTEILVFPAHE